MSPMMEEEMGLKKRHCEDNMWPWGNGAREKMVFREKVGSRRGWGRGEDVGKGENILQGKKGVLGDGKGDGVRDNTFLEEKTCP